MTQFMKNRLGHLIRNAFMEGALCVAHEYASKNEANLINAVETKKLEVEKQSIESFEMYEQVEAR